MTPDKCLKAGCCYEDIFMDEPRLQWHNPKVSIWCFKRKSIMSAGKLQALFLLYNTCI